MATMVKSIALEGIEGFEVEIEAVKLRGQQQMISIIGLGDQAVKESGERIQAAMESYGYDIPKDKVLISLAPGDRRKRGSHYDLGMTVAVLAETAQIAARELEKYVFIGELSLNGKLRSCKGLLPMVTAAKQLGCKSVIIPAANQKEAQRIRGIEIHSMGSLKQVVQFLEGRKLFTEKPEELITEAAGQLNIPDFSEVKGHEELIEAVVLAAAGGHNLLMIGEPGCGKSMIAERIPGILPSMSEQESLEVTKIHSIAGLLSGQDSLVTRRPFRSPHHNVSLNALIGGGTFAQPGEVSLAHLYWIWLCTLPGIGPVRQHRLLEVFRDPREIYHADREDFFRRGLNNCAWIRTVAETKNLDGSKNIFEKCLKNDIFLMSIYDDPYPQELRTNPELPILLYCRGQCRGELRGTGVVGARRCTSEDKQNAIKIASDCAKKGIPVISGMAKGIDAYAHTAVLRNGGFPVAFLGNSPDICYPVEHKGLMAEIISNRLLLSEYPPETTPRPYYFPRRNRLIAAWSEKLYVIGAGKNSGTRYTRDYYQRYQEKMKKQTRRREK